ncbi:MAG TPA: hypothetical protein PKH58_09635 [Paludibacteraceae bacterium]|nr:hypothetical protein [Paludibacteraceae bacterium]HPT43201.1 hypothetical protein [Paludibacteraceae bacterium]
MKIFLKLSGLILLMFVGCTFDSEIDELNAPALNKSKDQISLQTSEPKTVTVPIKADFYSIPDTILPGVGCTPTQANIIMKGGGWIGGNASHTGLVNLNESHWVMINCSFDPITYQLTTLAEGKITAANKDYYLYQVTMVTQLPGGDFTGEVTINDGTGKFRGATGTLMIKGLVDHITGIITFTGEGTITLVVGENHKK